MKIRCLLMTAFAAAVLLSTSQADVIIYSGTTDATPEDRNTLGPPLIANVSDGLGDSVQDRNKSDGTARAGAFATTTYPSRRAAVWAFQLPTLSLGESISVADFSVRLFSRQGTFTYNADLWALRTSGSSTVLASDYGAGTSPSGPAGQVLLQDNFATTSASTSVPLSTNSTADVALKNFLNANWVNGGYLFIRANVDGDPLTFAASGTGTLNQGYSFANAATALNANKPQLNITIVPEPSSVALVVATGASLLLLRRRPHQARRHGA